MGVSKWIGGYVGTRTAGAGGAKVDKHLSNTRLGNTLLGRDIRAATTGALAKNKMGYTRSHEEQMKEEKDVAKKRKAIDRVIELEKLVNTNSTDTTAYKNIVSQMSEEEKLELKPKILSNKHVLKHFKKSDLDAKQLY